MKHPGARELRFCMTMMAPAVGAAVVGATALAPVEAAAMPTDFAKDLLLVAGDTADPADDTGIGWSGRTRRARTGIGRQTRAFVQQRFGGDYDERFGISIRITTLSYHAVSSVMHWKTSESATLSPAGCGSTESWKNSINRPQMGNSATTNC